MSNEIRSDCFHCGLPVPDDADFSVSIHGNPQPMCCAGCQAVAQAIVSAGHERFYDQRTSPAQQGEELVPEFLRKTAAYDHPEVQRSFVQDVGDHTKEASLILEGITCAACVWLNEQHISQLPGVSDVQINYTTHRARVRWDDEQIKLSEILQAIHAIGYQAHPFDPDRQQQIFERMRRTSLLRIGVAAVFGMQVMMISAGLYIGEWLGIEPQFEVFFRWLLAFLTLPVLLYSAFPFFQAAWRDLRQLRVGMDVPVSLGIGIAFGASALATITNQGHVYFDSVVMFTFFLLSSRHFELNARKQNAEATETLALATPAMATRLTDDTEEEVPVGDLVVGDTLLVRPGEQIPTDGQVIEGRSGVDESLLTGESLPVTRTIDDELIGGSINTESPLKMRVGHIGQDTVLARILQMLDNAQAQKPRLATLAEKVASRFVAVILMLAFAVAWYWWSAGSERWLEITLSVLIVTCPCALSLATPTALSAATGALQRLGLLVVKGSALEALAQLTHFAFDKTGTLTRGKPELIHTWVDDGIDPDSALSLAAALEKESEHPLARALVEANREHAAPTAASVQNYPGAGIEGVIKEQQYFIGTPDFVLEKSNITVADHAISTVHESGATPVVLASADQVLAVFALQDSLRKDAPKMINAIHEAGLQTQLLTG
ncbi:MAG: heavy metal translocating P-type ATPase, partial [bacterium]